MNIPNVETLIASIDLIDYDNLAMNTIERLELLKEEAKSKQRENSFEVVKTQIGDMGFQILPNGSRHHAYILHNDFYEVKLARYRQKSEDSYPILIKIKAECMWSLGYKKAWEKVVKLIDDNIGQVKSNKISRMDLCCHTDEFVLNSNDIDNFSGRFRSDEIYRNDRKLTGFTFGSGANKTVFCRIYNKTLEVKQKRQKLWFFDIWKKKGMDKENIWNIEFQIGRKYFKKYNIETVEQSFEKVKSIWQYCTTEWLKYKDITNKRIERCSDNERWIIIQNAFNEIKSSSLIKREIQLERNADVLIPSIMGYITTYSARKGLTDLGTCIYSVVNNGLGYIERSKKNTFEDEVVKKIELINKEQGDKHGKDGLYS